MGTCDVYAPSATCNLSGLSPGDEVHIHAGSYTKLEFRNASGADGNPIIIKNADDGRVEYSGAVTPFYVWRSKHFQVMGNGASEHTYGILFEDEGVDIEDRCTNYELAWMEFDGARLEAKESAYPTWTTCDVKIHDLYIHGVNEVGVYAGHSSPSGNELMHRDYRIYSCCIVNCREGIQLGSCREGGQIFDNSLCNINPDQHINAQDAIQMNDSSGGSVFRNSIYDCEGDGIGINTTCPVAVYNNIIRYVGHTASDRQDGIHAYDTGGGTGQASIFNNTIIDVPDGWGVSLQGSRTSDHVWNNIILESASAVDPGGNPASAIHDNHDTPNDGYEASSYGFKDYSGSDWRLTIDSPAVNAGGCPALSASTDFDGVFRHDDHPDVGAYEYAITSVTEVMRGVGRGIMRGVL